MKNENENEITNENLILNDLLREPMRVHTKVAKKWLHQNQTIIMGGTVRFLAIRPLGLGIFEVKVAPVSVRSTEMTK